VFLVMNEFYFPDDLVKRYSKRFPYIDIKDHERIIYAAFDSEGIVWGNKEFIQWYDLVGERLQEREEVLKEILDNPYYAMFREAKIIFHDWEGKTILDKLDDEEEIIFDRSFSRINYSKIPENEARFVYCEN
jgi:hypothetical protein